MGKKLPQNLLKILTLMACLISPCASGVNTHATDQVEEKIYWTVPELIALREETDADTAEKCPGDYQCAYKLKQERMATEAKYRVLAKFEAANALVTAVNPETNTIRLYFNGENVDSYLLTGYPDIYELDQIYAAWIEPTVPENHYRTRWVDEDGVRSRYPLYVLLMQQGKTEEGLHPMVAETSDEYGKGWFTRRTEHEYTIPGADLLSNTEAKIYVAVYYGAAGTYGPQSYKECMNAGYRTGENMECRLVFSESGASYRRYVVGGGEYVDPVVAPDPDPVTPDPENPDPSNPDPSTPEENEPTNQPDQNPDSEDDENHSSNPGENGNDAPISGPQSSDSSTNSSSSASSSNTGTSAAQVASASPQIIYVPYAVEITKTTEDSSAADPSSAERTAVALAEEGSSNVSSDKDSVAAPIAGTQTTVVNFPWWLIVVLIVGDIAVVWWFLPARKKRREE